MREDVSHFMYVMTMRKDFGLHRSPLAEVESCSLDAGRTAWAYSIGEELGDTKVESKH